MSLTREESDLLGKFDDLSEMERDVVDATVKTLFEQSKWRNIKIVNDDRCARVEAAVIRVIIDSRN